MAIYRPTNSRRRHIPTLANAVDRLLSMDEVNPAESRAVERAINAVQSASKSFASYAPSSLRFYNARNKFVVGAPVTLTSMVVTSGSAVVAGSPSWPDWTTLGHLRTGERSYAVHERASDTLTVPDMPDGTYTNVTLEQMTLELPNDFRGRGSITDKDNYYPIVDVPAGLLQSWQDYWDWARSATEPRLFGAITGDQRVANALTLGIWPPYDAEKTLEMYYERYPHVPQYHRVSSGTISVSGTTATASASVFTADHVGATINFATGNESDYPNSLSSRDLHAGQRTITAYTSATAVEIDSTITASTLTYYISDPIDVQPGASEEAFYRLAEYEMLRQSRGMSGKVAQRFREFEDQFKLALADDSRYFPALDDGPYLRDHSYGIGDVTARPT